MKKIPLPGWRTIKSAVAVVLCFLIFLPWWGETSAEPGGIMSQVGPFYACIAAIICMQGSVAASVKQGLSRLFGTLAGGLIGLAAVSITMRWDNWVVLTLAFGLSVLLTIYVCNLARQPKACAIAAIVCCSIMLSHSGEGRYLYTITRMAETAVGIIVAVAVNKILPGSSEAGTEPEEGKKEG